MDELYISEIYIYPIKSLGGISLKQANVENKGLQYDRRWMLIDDEGTFVSQRKHTSLALLQVEIQDDLVLVYEKENPLKRISFPLSEHINKAISVSIWDDETIGFEVNTSVSKWFSQYLKMPVRLILMSEQTMRNVDERYALNNEVVSFADGYPNLIIGQASLNLLNEKLYEPIPMNRFRPNFVFTGGLPHSEDSFLEFTIGEVVFTAIKPCARCVLITVNQTTGVKSAEPLKTLSAYRHINNKIMFGQNLIHKGTGVIQLGDKINVKTWK